MNINYIIIVLGEPYSTFSEILGKYFTKNKKQKKKIILIGNLKLLKKQLKKLKQIVGMKLEKEKIKNPRDIVDAV